MEANEDDIVEARPSWEPGQSLAYVRFHVIHVGGFRKNGSY
jgi:hypothetical protein